MSARLIFAILSTILEEAGIAAAVLWGLPRIDIHIPIPALVVIMIAWAVFSVFLFRRGSWALGKKPTVGLTSMIGSKARAAKNLSPYGVIRIGGELWEAKSNGESIKKGEDVIVIGQDGLKLIVRRKNPDDLKSKG